MVFLVQPLYFIRPQELKGIQVVPAPGVEVVAPAVREQPHKAVRAEQLTPGPLTEWLMLVAVAVVQAEQVAEQVLEQQAELERVVMLQMAPDRVAAVTATFLVHNLAVQVEPV